MQPKKQFSIKIKSLTLALTLASGINITNSLADETTDAVKARAFGNAIEAFVANYNPSTQSYLAVYKAKGEPKSAENFTAAAINGKLDLTKQVALDFAVKHAEALDTGNTIVASVFNLDDPSVKAADKVKITAAAALFKDPIVLRKYSIYKDIESYLSLLKTLADSANNSTDSISDLAVTMNGVAGIGMLNSVIHMYGDNIVKSDGTNLGLATKEQRKEFFDYVVAYVSHKKTADNAVKGENFQHAGFLPDPSNKNSALYAKVVEALSQIKQADYQKHQGLHQITSDAELAAIASMSANEIYQATLVTEHNNKELAAIAAHFKAINNEPDENKKILLENKLAASLVPNINNLGHAAAAPVVKITNSVIDNRMQVLNNTGISSGDEFNDSNIWLRVSHLNYQADQKDDRLKYKQKSIGFGIGIDQQLNDKFNLGISYSYVKSDLDGEDDYMLDDDIKSHAFGVYATMMHGNLFADAQFNYIKDKINGTRTIGGIEAITYEHKGEVFDGVIGIGINVDFDNNYYLKPKVCLAFNKYTNNMFDEFGYMLAAKNINEPDYNSVELGIQLVAGKDIMLNNYKINPKIKLGFMYDLNDKDDKVSFVFVSTPFDIDGIKHDRSNFNAGVGVSMMLTQLYLDLDYEFKWSSNIKAHELVAKVGYKF